MKKIPTNQESTISRIRYTRVPQLCKFIILIMSVMLTVPLQGGTTGKIAGRIVSSSTGEPMAYCNITLKGTLLGATTDAEGNYLILNIPPGIYTVTASYIGYSSLSYTNVKVTTDFTTKLDMQLAKSVLEAGEEVVVIAERPLVTKDRTSSMVSISADEINVLPVTEISELLSLQAGFVNGHVRGGRSGEVVYAIDGVPVTDVYDGSSVVDVNVNSISELQFISGTFNAEYGKALSGYVNIVTKEPGRDFSGGFTSYLGDHVSNHTNIFRGIDEVSPVAINNIEGYLNVPLVQDKISFYGSARRIYFGGWQNARREYNPWHITVNLGPSEPLVSRYNFQKTGDGKIVPMNWNEKTNLHGTLIFKPLNTTTLKYTYLMDQVGYQDYDHSFSLNPDGNLKRFRDAQTHLLGITQMFSTVSSSPAIRPATLDLRSPGRMAMPMARVPPANTPVLMNARLVHLPIGALPGNCRFGEHCRRPFDAPTYARIGAAATDITAHCPINIFVIR